MTSRDLKFLGVLLLGSSILVVALFWCGPGDSPGPVDGKPGRVAELAPEVRKEGTANQELISKKRPSSGDPEVATDQSGHSRESLAGRAGDSVPSAPETLQTIPDHSSERASYFLSPFVRAECAPTARPWLHCQQLAAFEDKFNSGELDQEWARKAEVQISEGVSLEDPQAQVVSIGCRDRICFAEVVSSGGRMLSIPYSWIAQTGLWEWTFVPWETVTRPDGTQVTDTLIVVAPTGLFLEIIPARH